MPLLDAHGVGINFPFDPYPCQVDYMRSVVECLKKGRNAILESPTGTGKTLCLLCSSLAWLESKKSQIQSNRWLIDQQCSDDGELALHQGKQLQAGKLDNGAGQWSGELAPPKIIYASRTHSQLTQAVQELKRTEYSRFKVSVIGSREQLCIHPTVSKEKSNSVKVYMCRSKVKSRSCHFYNQVEQSTPHFTNEVMDIEDLVQMGKKMSCCPYYAARELKSGAEVIFLPYNYLLDPKLRAAHGVDLNGNIIIFDEAHNLEKICEDSASYDITSTDITSAIREVDSVVTKLQELGADEHVSAAFGSNSDQDVDIQLEDVLKMKMILMSFEAALDNVSLPKPKEGITKPGSFIFELLSASMVTYQTKKQVLSLIDRLIVYLTNEGGSSAFNTNGNALTHFQDLIKIVFSIEPASERTNLLSHQNKASNTYRVHVRQTPTDNFTSKNGGWGAKATPGKAGRTLSYWCFSPSLAMQDLVSCGVKSIILTSGTLSPISSFKSEMGIDFHIELENPHVIQPKQVWVGTLSNGPDNEVLCSDYHTRSKESYQKSLGNAVVNFTRIVPHGLLLFFPSYPVMQTCISYWQKGNIWARMDQMKPVYVEPKNKHEFNTAMEGYYEKINDNKMNGAIFAAVCRGKVSEGLDFADRNGRAVVITGLPFPPKLDPKVNLKMQFLDESRRSSGTGLSGREWYSQQATRAVNQAIGRVIRHKDDYGAIILCDKRFAQSSNVGELPSWVRPRCTHYQQFGQALRDMITFFKEAERDMPAPRPPKVRSSTGCVGAHFEPTLSHSSIRDLKKSTAFVSEVPSLNYKKQETKSLQTLGAQYDGQFSTYGISKGKNLIHTLTSTENYRSTFDSEEQLSPKLETVEKKTKEVHKKRKIVIKGEKMKVSSSCTEERIKASEDLLSTVKSSLNATSYKKFRAELREYKEVKDIDRFVSILSELFQDPDKHHLFQKFAAFVKNSADRQKFDAACFALVHNTMKPSEKRKPVSASESSPTTKKQRTQLPCTSKDTKSTNKTSSVSDLSSKTTMSELQTKPNASQKSVDLRGFLKAQSEHTCCKCSKLASAPFKSKCDHIACLACWKGVIESDKKCPECQQFVQSSQLTKMFRTSKAAESAAVP